MNNSAPAYRMRDQIDVQAAERLIAVNIKPLSVAKRLQQDVQSTIADLVKQSHFTPIYMPSSFKSCCKAYILDISIVNQQLRLLIKRGCNAQELMQYQLSVKPFAQIFRDYKAICQSFIHARGLSRADQLEAIDMARRGIHDEGARIVMQRFEHKINLDIQTARYFFSLFYSIISDNI